MKTKLLIFVGVFFAFVATAKADQCTGLTLNGLLENKDEQVVSGGIVRLFVGNDPITGTVVGSATSSTNGHYSLTIPNCGSFKVLPKFGSAPPYSGVWRTCTDPNIFNVDDPDDCTQFVDAPLTLQLLTGSQEELAGLAIPVVFRYETRKCGITITGTVADFTQQFGLDYNNEDGLLGGVAGVRDSNGDVVESHELNISPTNGTFSFFTNGTCGWVRIRVSANSAQGTWNGGYDHVLFTNNLPQNTGDAGLFIFNH